MRILCLTDFPIASGSRWLWDFVSADKVEVKFIHTFVKDRFKTWGKLIFSYPAYLQLAHRALEEIRSVSYDLVVAWESDTGLPLALLRRLFGIKTPALIVLNLSVHGPMSNFQGLLRFAVRGLDVVTVPTRFERTYYADLLDFPLERIVYCAYGIRDLYRNLPPCESQGFVFSGGRSERDYKTLFKAISDLPTPFIINARPFNLRGLKIPANAKVNNILPGKAFRDLNWCSSFVVVPVENVKQAAGISSVLYGMAAGKAVVASDVPGLHDYVREGETGILVPPQDAVALRRAIQTLWENPTLAARLGAQARQVYLKEYTFLAMAGRILQTIHKLAI